MQTHYDRNHERSMREFWERLKERADEAVDKRLSEITTGKPGEQPLASWRSHGVECVNLPDDEQGILRISIGGGHPHVELNYCNFRGDVGKCIDLLERAITALRACPE